MMCQNFYREQSDPVVICVFNEVISLFASLRKAQNYSLSRRVTLEVVININTGQSRRNPLRPDTNWNLLTTLAEENAKYSAIKS